MGCEVEEGWTCDSDDFPSQCQAICSDGLVLGDEECDIIDVDEENGCSDTCQAEPGYECDVDGIAQTCYEICGD